MAQAHVQMQGAMESVDISGDNDLINKRKVNFNLDGSNHVSVFQNEAGRVAVNIRRGTRSVTISKETLLRIFELKETLVLCCNFIDP